VHNPGSTSDHGTFESIAVRSRARAASLITQFIGTRATSLIAQFPATCDGSDPECPEARAASLYHYDGPNESCRIHVEDGTLSLRASPLIRDIHKK